MELELTKAAYTAISTLKESYKVKAEGLIETLKEDSSSIIFSSQANKIKSNGQDTIYSIRLSDKLRMLVQMLDDRIIILDILNHDLYNKYF